MSKIIDWIKSNKITAVLVVLIAMWVLPNFFEQFAYKMNSRTMYSDTYSAPSMQYGAAPSMESIGMPTFNTKSGMYAPESVAPSADRKVITDNSASLVVKGVVDAIDNIQKKTTEYQGFVVNVDVNRPTESANGSIRVRIPFEKSAEFIKYLESISIKVSSFNTTGMDVTDQYTDLDARLEVLEESYTRINAIYRSAENVDEMLRVQLQLFTLRDQIDSILGQKEYIENTSKTTAFTIYLSEDEYSLPYSPEGKWRPEVVYKLAIRSLVSDFRGIGNNLIWIGVYAVLWLPLLIVSVIAYKLFRNKIGSNRSRPI